MRPSPRSSAIWPARMAPPAGPDSTSRTGNCAAVCQAGEAAARGHQVDRPRVAQLREGALQAVQIARHERPHVGVGDGGGGALVLAGLRADGRRQADADGRVQLGQDGADALLVHRVGVGVDQRHGDRLDALVGDAFGDLAHGLLVERPANGAMHVEALGHREAQLARHQGRRLDDVDVVLVEAALVGDLDHVAEAVGGDQGGLGAFALDDGVGGERGAVHEQADVRERQAGGRERALRAVDDGLLRRTRRGQNLADEAALAVEENDVGKCSADVDSQPGCPALRAHGSSFVVRIYQTPRLRLPARGCCSAGLTFSRRGRCAAPRDCRAGWRPVPRWPGGRFPGCSRGSPWRAPGARSAR